MRKTIVGSIVLLALLSAGCIDSNGDITWSDEDRPKSRPNLVTFDLPTGDVSEPTTDLAEVAAGETHPATGDPRIGVGVRTAGGPTPDSFFSKYIIVETINVVEEIERSVTVQRHDGVDSTITDGVAEEDVIFVETPFGGYVEFPRPPGWDPDDVIIRIFSGSLENDGDAIVEDESGDLQFDETKPVEDILSEIEEVFVPS